MSAALLAVVEIHIVLQLGSLHIFLPKNKGVPSSGTPYIRLVQVRAPTSEALPALLLEVPVVLSVSNLPNHQLGWLIVGTGQWTVCKRGRHNYPPIGREH